MVGDVANAKKIVIANYDTPQHTYGNPMTYYPFNGPSTFSSSILPIYTPAILGGVFMLFLVLVMLPKLDFSNNMPLSVLIVIIIILTAILSFILTKGVANKVNFNRNTSGVVAALALAEKLADSDNKDTAFILTDNGCTNHAGDYMVRDALPKTIDQRNVILLDCVGAGEEFYIGYKETSKKMASDIRSKFDEEVGLIACPPENLRYTSFSFYQKAVIISRIIKSGESLIVKNVSTNNDTTCDAQANAVLVSALHKYLTN